ncbi:MAG: hypothetical protein FWG14_01625 [Peptococcaceae bacterium]|nr:hypothetical protein [Peptococcaceae bacterium]
MNVVLFVIVGLGCLVIFLATCLFALIIRSSYLNKKEYDYIISQGIIAEATIKSMSQTGSFTNNNPCAIVGLLIHKDGSVLETSVRVVVPVTKVPDIQVGKKISIKYLETEKGVKVAVPGFRFS